VTLYENELGNRVFQPRNYVTSNVTNTKLTRAKNGTKLSTAAAVHQDLHLQSTVYEVGHGLVEVATHLKLQFHQQNDVQAKQLQFYSPYVHCTPEVV
jgi:hypothetical protein